MVKDQIVFADYSEWIANLKQKIAGARQRMILAANEEQIKLYHEIGKDILNKQKREGWGAKVINRIAVDLCEAFPEMKGFSSSNLKYMRYFAKECPNLKIGQQSADLLPWFHIITILTNIRDSKVREWYAIETVSNAWARNTLIKNIRTNLHLRQGSAITNFKKSLPVIEAEIAAEILKDPYNFDFLGLNNEAYEREIENQIKAPDDKPTIGLLLCKTKKKLVAEYALSGIDKPIGVAEYQLVRDLPQILEKCLPTIEELEAGLSLKTIE